MDRKIIKTPNILIVSSTQIGANNQTAITLKNIWGRWPKHHLMEVVIDYNNSIIAKNNDAIIYEVVQPIKTLAQLSFSKELNCKLKNKENKHKTDIKNNKITNEKIRQFIYSIMDCSPIYLKKQDIQKIDKYKPDIIYTMGGSIAIMKLSYRIAKRYNINIIPHFMDNWPECFLWEDNELLKYYRLFTNLWLKKIYSRTKCALTISEAMAIDYEKKSGIKHISLMNSVNVEKWKCKPKIEKDKCIFVYAGALNLGRDKSLDLISKALADINKNMKKECEIHVYTSEKYENEIHSLLKNNNIKAFFNVTHENILDVYDKADILILSESIEYDPIWDRFTKYSISTKVAEYLSSGRIVLYIGHKKKFLTEYLESNKAAIVISSKENVTSALKSSLECGHMDIIKNALELARKNHNSEGLTQKIREIVNMCI